MATSQIAFSLLFDGSGFVYGDVWWKIERNLEENIFITLFACIIVSNEFLFRDGMWM